jgi:hypothetical protein
VVVHGEGRQRDQEAEDHGGHRARGLAARARTPRVERRRPPRATRGPPSGRAGRASAPVSRGVNEPARPARARATPCHRLPSAPAHSHILLQSPRTGPVGRRRAAGPKEEP